MSRFVLLAVLFCPFGFVKGEDLNLWPVDTEQNQRLDALEKGQAEILAKLDTLFAPMKTVPDKASVSVQVRTVPSTVQKYIPQGRSVWVDSSGGVTDAHLAGHGYNPAIFRNNTYQERLWLHGDAHEGRRKVVGSVQATTPAFGVSSYTSTSTYRSNVVVERSGCPGGNCPVYSSKRRGLIGRIFR